MSDIMLVNPSSKEFLTNAGDRMPLGLLYMAGYLENKGHNVRVRDMDHTELSSLVKEVKEIPPDILGVSVYTSVLYPQAIALASLFPNIRKVAGGYHATAMPESLTDYFDAVVVGEGEIALDEIAKNNLEGVIEGIKTPVESISHPARHLLNEEDYTFNQDGRKATTLMSSRGCPNACVFCGNMNRSMRYFDDDFVVEEITQLKDWGYNDFYFLDDAFSINRKRTMGLIDRLGKLDISYRATMRAKSVDKELAEALYDSGCSWVSLGIESGSDKCLKAVGKNMTTEDNVKAVMNLASAGIHVKGFFIIGGVPFETEEDAIKTINFAESLYNMGLTSADFYSCMPYPGTVLWDDPDKYGIEILDRDYTKYLQATTNEGIYIASQTKDLKASRARELLLEARGRWKNRK